jgi:hypothetical protein
MERGYLGSESFIRGVKWFAEKSKLGTGGVELVKPGGLGMVYLEGRRCPDCKLLLLRY